MPILSLLIHTAHAAETEAAANPGLLGTFGVSGTLFVAQLVNFIIVVFVLWRWVFKPLVANMQARTEKIEACLVDAKQLETAKKEFESWKAEQMRQAQAEASSIVNTAAETAEGVKAKILADATREQEQLIARTKQQLEQEREQTISTIKSQAASLITNATEKIIRQKLTSKADETLINDTVKGLQL